MTRLRCFCLCACLALALTATTCGSGGGSSGWDQARIGNTGVGWWVNAIKSAYFFSLKITPSSQDDTVGRGKVITFTQEVVSEVKSSTAAPETLVPSAPTAPSTDPNVWTLDQDSPKTANGVATANDPNSAVALVDGAADPFYAPNADAPNASYQAKALAWEVYTNQTYSLSLQIWQMASSHDASQVYTDTLSNSLYSNVSPWITCSGSDPSNPCPAS